MSKLLLVEDDNNLREIYEARLQAEGYSIVTAKDGEEALVVAKAEHPDLIISDIMMPKISGFEMLDILRNTENLKNVPVIMLTALGQNDDQQRADKLGADRYLVKSQVTLEDIVRVAHELLGDAPATPEASPTSADSSSTLAPATPAAPTAAPPAVAPAPAVTATPPEPPVAPATPEPAAPTTTVATEATDSTSSTTLATDSTGSSASAAATTTAQEGAAVNARIEDFVAGATQDAAPAPEQTEVTASTESTPTETESDQTPTTEENETTAAAPAPATPAAAAEDSANDSSSNDATNSTTPQADETPAADSVAPTETSAPETPEESPTKPSGSPVVHDKVIKPLETDPTKDINTLLALETAKEASKGESKPTVTPVVMGSAQPTTTPTPTEPGPPTSNLGATQATPPNTVITPDESEATTEEDETVANQPVEAPASAPSSAIKASSTATAPVSETEEAGTDLNNIAL